MKKTNQMIIFLCLLALLVGCGPISIDMDFADTNTNSPSTDPETNADSVDEAKTPQKSGDLIPDGVLINTGNENKLSFIDENGGLLQDIETPGIMAVEPEDTVIAGRIDPNGAFPAVVFHSWLPEQAIMVNKNGMVEIGRESDTFLAFAGAPGQPAFAFSEVKINEENNPHGFLYAAKPDILSETPSFYNLVDEPFYWALKPVGVATTGGEAQGVWYVKTAWGIGGADLIFPINRGLYYFDLTNGDNKQYLDDERSLQGISPDLSLAASIAADSSGDVALSVTSLENNQTVQFPLNPATDRGAGWAVFSPDNQFVAWLEATGSMISDPFDFHPRVRVGDVQTGGVVQAVDDSAAAPVINGDMVTMMRPAGWLDNKTVLIEVRGKDWDDVSLLQFDTSNGNLSGFSAGAFLAFGYQ